MSGGNRSTNTHPTLFSPSYATYTTGAIYLIVTICLVSCCFFTLSPSLLFLSIALHRCGAFVDVARRGRDEAVDARRSSTHTHTHSGLLKEIGREKSKGSIPLKW